MIDLDAAALAFVQSHTGVNTAVAGRIYAGDVPPEDYNPTDGGCVVIKSRGGPQNYDDTVRVSFQVKCYGPDSAAAAWTVHQAAHQALHGRGEHVVKYSQTEVAGQSVIEPGTGRHYILAFYSMLINVSD